METAVGGEERGDRFAKGGVWKLRRVEGYAVAIPRVIRGMSRTSRMISHRRCRWFRDLK